MSCGEPHDVDCAEILDRVYVFIDNEMSDATLTSEAIRAHLEECGPCLRKYDLERVVKSLVARSCGCEHASDELRSKVLFRIQQVQVHISESPEG